MTDMGVVPPSPGPTEDSGKEIPAEQMERADALEMPRELPSHVDFRTEIERANQLAGEIYQRRYASQHGRGQRGDATVAAATARQLATLILARLAVPGDVELHEAVFRIARRLVAEQQGLGEGELGDLGVLTR